SFETIARGRQSWQVEDRALHERAAGLLGGVLVQRDDVGPRTGEERTHRSNQPRSIGAAQQEPTHILYWQSPATCARVLLLHLHQGVTPRCVESQNGRSTGRWTDTRRLFRIATSVAGSASRAGSHASTGRPGGKSLPLARQTARR